MKTRTIWILSGILAVFFILFLVAIKVWTDIEIGTGGMIIWIIIIILLAVGVDFTFWYLRVRKEVKEKEQEKKKLITLDEARNKVKELLMSEQYSEYERESLFEKVWHVGKSKTPMYVKLIKGEFDGDLFGIIVNMNYSDITSVQVYKEVEITREEILQDMKDTANGMAEVPEEIPDVEEEIIERPSGERTHRFRKFRKEEEKKEQGGLE